MPLPQQVILDLQSSPGVQLPGHSLLKVLPDCRTASLPVVPGERSEGES